MGINKLVSLFWHQSLDSPKFAILHKILKTARLAIDDRVVFNYTNIKLLAANVPKINKLNLLFFNTIIYLGARVLSLTDLEERKQLAKDKKWWGEAKLQAEKQK